MKKPLHKTIINFRSNLEMLLEDIKLEKEDFQLAFYFDTEYLARAALGYKDYYEDNYSYEDDETTFREDKFNSDITLVCSLLSGGFLGEVRMLRPHQDEFLRKVNSNFDGVNYMRWRDEVRTFVADAQLDLNADEYLVHLQNQSEDALLKRFTEYTEITKKGFNVSHCLLPWDRRVEGWMRKGLLILEENKPDYDSIFSSKEFHALKKELDRQRSASKINNFMDATALSSLIALTREFKNRKSKLAPRFFMPRSERNVSRGEHNALWTALQETGLISEFEYSYTNRRSSVLRNEEYFFYRAFFLHIRKNSINTSELEEKQIEQLYEKTSEIVERKTFDSISQTEFSDNSLQEVIDRMENYSFLKNIWIEFINSGDLKDILKGLENIKRQFDEARNSYEDMSFMEQIKAKLQNTRKNIFNNLDEVKRASILWEDLSNVIVELRGKNNGTSGNANALFRNRKLFRYGFPEKCHSEIKDYLTLLLSNETEAKSTQKAMGKIVGLYMKARNSEENLAQEQLILISAVFCALELKDKLKTFLEKLNRKRNLHYSLQIALAGVEFDSNDYKQGKNIIDELERLYYSEQTKPDELCDLAIGLTYLYYYAWLARIRLIERDSTPSITDQSFNQEVRRLINNAIMFAERATSLVNNKPLAQRVYAYNQYLFCLVESENPENNKKMKNIFPKLNDYRNQADVWSYMYYDTLSRYFRWRATGQTEKKQKKFFMNEAVSLSDDAIALAPNDEEIKKFRTQLIDEIDSIESGD